MTRSVASDEAASGPRPRAGFRLPRAARLRKTREIRRTMREGRRSRGRFVDVFSAPSLPGRPRVGIIAPRHGRTAVERNRVQRRLTEIARLDLLPALETGRLDLDLILRAKPAAYEASYRKLHVALLALMDSLEAVCAR
ncbi:ribonuclease P protein component [Candidatus Palauibacter sp.]|uniref:ribonuclease P protein component n=1 Tax=Candidatus Palauibacter sp. TaxID=3101350 RepID=UPI003AF1FCD1